MGLLENIWYAIFHQQELEALARSYKPDQTFLLMLWRKPFAAAAPPPACVIWVSNLLQDQVSSLYGLYARLGQKIVVPNKTICQADFYLKKFGNPTGTLYCRIRKVSDDSIVETSSTTLDVSTLTDSLAWYSFAFNSLVNEEVRIHVEFTGGDSSNYVDVGYQHSDVIIGCWTWYYNIWFDTSYDCTIKIYEQT